MYRILVIGYNRHLFSPGPPMKNHLKGVALVIISLVICYLMMSLRASHGSIVLEGLIFFVSLFALVKAAGVFTLLSTSLGDYLGISKLATGILIIAIGTSAPELFASIGAAIQGQPEMVVGNVLGTIVANSLLGIGCGALAASTALTVHKDVFGTQMSTFLAAIFLALGGLYDGVLVWYEGAILVIVLGFYLHHVIKTSNSSDNIADTSHDTHTPDEANEHPIPYLIILLVVSLAALFASGDYVVSSLIEGAIILDYSSTKLATSILAVGTSIPEIATAIAPGQAE